MTEVFKGSFTQQEPIPENGIDRAVEVLRSGRLHRYNQLPGEDTEAALLEAEETIEAQADAEAETAPVEEETAAASVEADDIVEEGPTAAAAEETPEAAKRPAPPKTAAWTFPSMLDRKAADAEDAFDVFPRGRDDLDAAVLVVDPADRDVLDAVARWAAVQRVPDRLNQGAGDTNGHDEHPILHAAYYSRTGCRTRSLWRGRW